MTTARRKIMVIADSKKKNCYSFQLTQENEANLRRMLLLIKVK